MSDSTGRSFPHTVWRGGMLLKQRQGVEKRGRSPRSFVAIALGSLVLLQLLLSSGSTSLGAPSRRGMLGVARVPDASLTAVDAFSDSIGQPPALWTIFRHWVGPGSTFPP